MRIFLLLFLFPVQVLAQSKVEATKTYDAIELRNSVIGSVCPAPDSEEAKKCPGGMFEQKIAGSNICICQTHQTEKLVNEIDASKLAASKKIKQLVCEEVRDKKTYFDVKYVAQDAIVAANCVTVAQNLIYFPFTSGVPSDITTQLELLCGSCVTEQCWGQCPRCRHPHYEKTCAEVCK